MSKKILLVAISLLALNVNASNFTRVCINVVGDGSSNINVVGDGSSNIKVVGDGSSNINVVGDGSNINQYCYKTTNN